MRVGWLIAINNLWSRKVRTILLIVVVAFSTALAVSVSAAFDSINASVRSILRDNLGQSDLRVRHQTQGRINAEILTTFQDWHEVSLVVPRLTSNISVENLETGNREVIQGQGIPFDLEWKIRQPDMLLGVPPVTPDQVMLDPRAAQNLEVTIGDTIRIGSFGTETDVIITGIHKRQTLAVLQQPEMRLDISVLQKVASYPNRLTSIDIVLHKNTNPREVLAKYKNVFEPPIEIVPSDLLTAGLDRQMRGTSLLYAICAACAFLIAGFIVLTGMTTAITEQTRVLAILRCIGASRIQLMISQMLSGIIIGLFGGLVGTPIGIGVSYWIYSQYAYLVRGHFIVSTQGIAIALIGAICAGFLGAAIPAIAASRVVPLTALTVRARSVNRRSLLFVTIIAVCLLMIPILVARLPDNEQVAFWLTILIGLPSMIFGWFLLGVTFVRVLAKAIAPTLSTLLRLPHGLLQDSLLSTPFRHGFTAGALMLGLAAMISMWSSSKGILDDWLGPIQFPDAFAITMTGIPEDRADAAADLPFVDETCKIGLFKVPALEQHLFGIKGVAPDRVHFISFEPTPFFEMTKLEFVQGDPNTALDRLNEGGTILVAREFLTARGIGVGDHLILGTEDNPQDFEIVGVVSSPGLDIATSIFGVQGEFHEQAIHCVFASRKEAQRCFGNDQIQLLQFSFLPNTNDEIAKKEMATILGPVQFGSGVAIKSFLIDLSNAMTAAASSIAILAMLIASLGMSNVIAANIESRRYEYGVLRAIGATKGVLIKLILAESILIGFAACIVGTGMGLFDAWNSAHLYRIMAGVVSSPSLHPLPILAGSTFIIIIAIGASLIPLIKLIRQTPCSLISSTT